MQTICTICEQLIHVSEPWNVVTNNHLTCEARARRTSREASTILAMPLVNSLSTQ